MTTLLNNTDPNNRLIEALGSAALFSDNTSASSPLGLPLNVLSLGDTEAIVYTNQSSSNGQAAASNDVASVPGALNGDAGLAHALPLDQVLSGLPVIGNADAGSILSGLDLNDLGLAPVSSAAGTTTAPLDLVGSGTTLQPVADAANALIKDVHYTLEALSHKVGLPNVVHTVTDLGEIIGLGEIGSPPAADGHSNLISDTLNLPGDILSGNLNGGIANVGHNLTNIIDGTASIVNTALFDGVYGNDPTNVLPEVLTGIGNTLQTLPLLTVNGGNNANSGLIGGIVGDLSHSSSGHLIDADVGPQQSDGLVFDLLSAPSGDGHTASVNAVDVGPSGPHLLDLGLLTGDGITGLPALSGGTDGLVGNVLGDHGLLGGSLLGGVTGGAAPTAAVTALVVEVADIAPTTGGLGHGLLDLHGTHLI